MTPIDAVALTLAVVAWLVLCQFVIYIMERLAHSTRTRSYRAARKALNHDRRK